MKLHSFKRRPLWLLALPILLAPALSHAQDEAPEPAADPNAVIDPAPIDPAAPVDPGVVEQAEQKAIGTMDFASYLQSLGGAGEITVSVENATPAQVAQELAKQIGQRVEASPQWEAYPDTKISFKVGPAPLWDALGQMKARGVDAQWIAPTRTLQLMPLNDASEAKVPPANPLSQRLGAAILGVSRVQRTRALLFPGAKEVAQGERLDRFELDLTLRPDPRWKTVDGTASWAGLTLVDAKGTSHLALSEAVGGTIEGAQAAFNATKVDTGGPITLKGELRFVVVSKSQKWNLADLSKPAQIDVQREGVPVRYEYLGSNQANGSLSLRFTASNAANAPGTVVELPSPDPNIPSSNLPLYHFAGVGSSGGLRLLKGDGALVEFMEAGSGIQSTERSEFEVQTMPDLATNQPAVPTRAEVDVPLEWREVRVPFEIKNIPLP